MAPLPPGLKKPAARSFRQQRISGAVHPLAPLKTFRADAAPLSDDFSSSKRDKRLMKHSSFLSRVASSSSSAITKKTKNKRTGRGRSKKLATTLSGLADALPELEDGAAGVQQQQGKVRHSSIKSKRGALKKKERVVKGEMERFGVNMAQLASTQQQADAAAAAAAVKKTMTGEEGQTGGGGEAQKASSSTWAALRGYISSTMEQNPAFVGRT